MNFFEKLTYIALEANSYCNLHCLSCNRDRLVEAGLRSNKNISLEELRHILNQVADCPIDTVKLQILSEPMFHPQIDILAQEIKIYFPKSTTILATNLQYAPEKTPFFKTIPFVDIIYLSIDGVGDIYEKLRKGADYEKLLNSLKTISKNTTKQDRQKLQINFTLTPENYLELPKVYKLKEEYDLGEVRINLAQNWNEDEKNNLIFTDEIINFLKQYSKDVKGVPNWDYKDCFWPYSGVTIDVYGNVRQCIINTTQKPLGNVYEKPLKAIFNESPEYKNIRTQLALNSPPDSCKNCDYKYLSNYLSKLFAETDLISKIKPRGKGPNE